MVIRFSPCSHNLITSPLILQPIKAPLNPTLLHTTPRFRTIITCKIEPPGPNNSEKKKKKTTMNGGPNKPSRRNPRRSSYGTSRRSVLKKTFIQEQVMFTAPVSGDPVVAVIGGGMSGLLCALNLDKRGIRSTVFDTGLHGLGGRMGTRIIDPHPLIFDHAAQFFTVSDPRFSELVDGWSEKGLVREWKGTIGELERGGLLVPLPPSPTRYIGVDGMRPLADSILSQARMVDVVRPCWISKLEPYNGMWYLSENGKPCGQFDAIVIAHNGITEFTSRVVIVPFSTHGLSYIYLGKCANRLLASSGLPLIARQMKRLELSSIWALMAAFEDPLPIPNDAVGFPIEGAFVKGVDSVSWIGNNTRKLLCSQSSGSHCWTIFSTESFGKRNKVPQENIPTATAERVKESMLEGVETALGLSKGSLTRPFYTRVQLWGAALPTNTPGIPCIFDPHGRAGICGDWLLGSNLESAALSGMALANHIADYFQSGGARPEEFAVGLHNEFEPLEGHDIGQFPGLESEEQRNEAETLQVT